MPKGSGKPIPKVKVNLKLSDSQSEDLIETLKGRFNENMDRHKGLAWKKIQAKLESNPKKLASLKAMESTDGEPDVIGFDKKTNEYLFVDCSDKMGVELLTEEQYRYLQKLGEFDTKTESWLKTPTDVRELGGAIFAARRYGRVFVFHNSAPSFYSSRGFRGMLRL